MRKALKRSLFGLLGFSLLAMPFITKPTQVSAATNQSSAYSWQFISQTASKSLVGLSPGETAVIRLTAKNTGSTTWSNTGPNPVHVGTTNPRDRASAFAVTGGDGRWLGVNRPVGLPGGTSSVAPGATVTFTWTYRAPARAGTYREGFSLVAEGATWMNDPGVNYYTVVNGNYSWQFVSQSASTNLANLTRGQVATISLTAQNTGNTIWYRSSNNPVRVGTTNPRDRSSAFANGNWLGANRPVGLPEGTNSVAPGATVTFTWTYTAPATPGTTYREHFSLVAEGITWMNDPGVNYYTVVNTGALSTAVSAAANADVLSKNGGTLLQSFTPVLGATAYRGVTAYYGIHAVTTVDSPSNTDQWRITLHKDGTTLTTDTAAVTEKGYYDPTDGAVADSAYTPTIFAGNLVFTGNYDWNTKAGDDFTNVDGIVFGSTAPLGTYTITRELVDHASGYVISNSFVKTVTLAETVTVSAAANADVLSENGGAVLQSFTPVLGATAYRGVEAYYGVNGVTAADSSNNDQWKIVVHKAGATLTTDMATITEKGWYDATGGEVADSNYTAATNAGDIVFSGNFDWNTKTGDNFTNVDGIIFNDAAPLGTYTISRLLYDHNTGTVLSNPFVKTVTLAETVTVSAAANADVLSENGGAVLQSFTPVLGATIAIGSTAYYGVNALTAASSSDNNFWKITVHKDNTTLATNMVTIAEKGWYDPTDGAVADSAYTKTLVGDDVVLTGNHDWNTKTGDNFTNVDSVVFATNAPLGTYTITRALYDYNGGGTPKLLSNSFVQSVTVTSNSGKAITAFTIPGQVGDTVINESAKTVTIHVPFGTVVTALVPTIAVTPTASVSPVSGLAQNFTSPVVYTVTANDSTYVHYTVTVIVNPPV